MVAKRIHRFYGCTCVMLRCHICSMQTLMHRAHRLFTAVPTEQGHLQPGGCRKNFIMDVQHSPVHFG